MTNLSEQLTITAWQLVRSRPFRAWEGVALDSRAEISCGSRENCAVMKRLPDADGHSPRPARQLAGMSPSKLSRGSARAA